jgi:invasion protein IalB
MQLCPDGQTGAWRQRASFRIAASLVFAMPMAAQNSSPAPAQDVAAWRVECAGDGKTLDCRAVQQLFQRETRQLVLSILVRKAQDPKAAAVTIQLPLGLSLTDPVVMKVDNGQPERQPIQTCTNVGCFVTFTANDKLVAAMRTGTELKITVMDASKKAIDLSVPLLGFALAFDKARS